MIGQNGRGGSSGLFRSRSPLPPGQWRARSNFVSAQNWKRRFIPGEKEGSFSPLYLYTATKVSEMRKKGKTITSELCKKRLYIDSNCKLVKFLK